MNIGRQFRILQRYQIQNEKYLMDMNWKIELVDEKAISDFDKRWLACFYLSRAMKGILSYHLSSLFTSNFLIFYLQRKCPQNIYRHISLSIFFLFIYILFTFSSHTKKNYAFFKKFLICLLRLADIDSKHWSGTSRIFRMFFIEEIDTIIFCLSYAIDTNIIKGWSIKSLTRCLFLC